MEIIPVNEIYGDRFFRRRNSLNWRARPICAAVRHVLSPASVIDVGCAIGDLVDEFRMLGIDAYGLEGSEACMPYLECSAGRVFWFDLRLPLPEKMNTYDLVTCFEVAEHIEPEYAEQFAKNLASLSGRLLISAAPPGQGGHHHVNCRPMEYWDDMFGRLGYRPDAGITGTIRARLAPWKNKPGVKAIYQNLAYFGRAHD